jgi:hypothetical protein
MNDQVFFDGDPARDSTRRHLERVLRRPQERRWQWFLAMFAGGSAYAFWRFRRRKRHRPSPPG